MASLGRNELNNFSLEQNGASHVDNNFNDIFLNENIEKFMKFLLHNVL